jgi:predicted TIM-barrel fold metal-dependent hydrolase
MVIATGHLKPDDIFTLLDMAKSLGIWKIIVNHPLTKVVGASLDEQVEMSANAYLEYCFVTCMERHDNLDPVLIRDSIKKIGANRCLMATDFGQIFNPRPVNGMKMFINSMIHEGISLDEINLMCKDNPHKLIN